MHNARKALAVLALIVFTLSTAAAALAQGTTTSLDDAYIQINNGSTISVTGTEQPFIVVQLGNRGQQTIEDVQVICGWDGLIRFAGQTQNGPFGEPELVIGSGEARLDWPQAVDLRPGQNYNVGFNIRFALPEPDFKGDAGILVCVLDAGPDNLKFTEEVQVTIR